jgi:dTDP-4-amino-4,6-dideoxygalactose transaminase
MRGEGRRSLETKRPLGVADRRRGRTATFALRVSCAIFAPPIQGLHRELMSNRDYIVFGSPVIDQDAIEAVARTVASCWLGTGPRVAEFEREFARYVGASHSVATASCTAALHLALSACPVGRGDEVITTPMTFCATANAILHTGATPVFADCELDTMNIDPNAIEAAITPRTKAIVAVHFAGRGCNMDAIGAIARRHGLFVIEDAAHAIETTCGPRKVGSISDATCFSFYVTKNLTTGEGGMITTNRPELAAQCKVLALHGLSADAWQRFSDKGYRHYDVVRPGFKYNLTDMAASLGLSQLPKLTRWLARREQIWAQYDHAFRDLPVRTPLPPQADSTHARHLYTLLIQDDAPLRRDEFVAGMHELGIGTGVHYRALHTHRYYRDTWGYVPEQFPNAWYIGERTVSLPLSAKLTDADVDRVIHSVRRLLS